MKRMLPLSLFCFTLLFQNPLQAQNDRFAYAITDLTREGSAWNALRRLDLKTGEYSPVLFDGTKTGITAYDAVSKKAVALARQSNGLTIQETPFGSGVAAAAFDRRHNRLYFIPMFSDGLRYLDLKSMKLFIVSGSTGTEGKNGAYDEASIYTRMVIAPDGNGYAISNDGKSFLRFTTGKKPTVTQLGSLIDDPSNNGVSVHNRSTSFGGDMIADDAGNLYILSARNQVFRVQTGTRTATHLGTIEGLPKTFTVNGAVVDEEGSLLVSSAVDGKSYYVVDPSGWTAIPYELGTSPFRSSDLANSNFLATGSLSRVRESQVRPAVTEMVSIYPNPVVTNRFTVRFSGVEPGSYTLALTDISGRSVLRQRVVVARAEQVQSIPLSRSWARGVYLVKVTGTDSKPVLEQKILVQ